jgi:two-component system nitrate/nitrite response regulator NarL
MITEPIKQYCRHTVITAHNEDDLKSAINIHNPFLVLIDSCAWQKATPYVVEYCKKKYPKTLIAVFSFESMSLKEAVDLIQRGARGMVNVRFDDYAFSRGIRTLVDGEEYIPPEVEAARDKYSVSYDSDIVFTPREEQIYRLMAEGKTSVEMTEKLRLAFPTVRNHRQNIYRKCGVSNSTEFWRFAQTRGDFAVRDFLSVKQIEE